MAETDPYPQILPVGLTGVLVRFAATLSEPANRAALAFRAAILTDDPPGIEEVSTSLTGTFLRIDPLLPDPDALLARVQALLASRDWYGAPLPQGRRHLAIPCVLGGDTGPDWAEVATRAGLAAAPAAEALARARVRVLTIGFAPGQPYMGQLPPEWDIPRRSTLNPQVPEGALVLAIRQIIIFSAATQTGWHHVGQSAFRLFRPDAARPFALNPGDEVSILPVSAQDLQRIRDSDTTGDGGARIEAIA